MKNTILLAMGLVAAGTFGAYAADLEVPEQATPMAPASPAVFVKILAGPTLPLDATFFDPIPAPGATTNRATKVGYAAAATVGVVVAQGISVDVDAMFTNRGYSASTGSISSLSAMADVMYTLAVTDSVAVYIAGGAGYISYTDSFFAPASSAGGFGYQAIAGVSAKVADNISVVGEARYQSTFSPVKFANTSTISAPTVSFLAGLQFGMN